jgi:putative transposase
MAGRPPYSGRDDHLKRLPADYYRGRAFVHWSMTMEDRKTGWLVPIFYYKFREILTHTAFRYGICCPIYCCMPDYLQREAYDHVLREEELERTAFEEVFQYIARNPERADLVPENGFRDYPYTGCLVPGYSGVEALGA